MSRDDILRDMLVRFVQKTDTCWLWTNVKNNSGYGFKCVMRRPELMHRASWRLANGPIPDGMCILHRCDVPACVNPDHLFLGTQAENIADRVAKGRSSRGAKHSAAMKGALALGSQRPNALLDESEVAEIKRLYSDGSWSVSSIGDKYGVRMSTVSEIIRGRNWKHVPGPEAPPAGSGRRRKRSWPPPGYDPSPAPDSYRTS